MASLEWARTLGRVLLDLLYPSRCVGCGQTNTVYCSACRDSVLLVKPPVCPLCGRPQSAAELCKRCSSRSLRVRGIRSVALFEGTLRDAIHQFKYAYVRDLAGPLGELLITFWQRAPLAVDVIVPVPLHRRRLRERGYNQASLLAERLGRFSGKPVRSDVLYRNRHTVSQTRLSPEERRRNVAGAFSCVGSGIKGKRVLLIDDVYTTGATLEACSIALQVAGVQSVWALTVARAP